MKTEDLRKMGLNEGQAKQIASMHGAEMQKMRDTVAALTAERDEALAQLGGANAQLEGYDPEWKQKIEQAQQKAQEQLAAIERNNAAELAASGLAFTSKSARRTFLSELKASNLPVKDGEILGFTEFVQNYRAKDPAAFGAAWGYPSVQDGGDPVHLPSDSPKSRFAEWLGNIWG